MLWTPPHFASQVNEDAMNHYKDVSSTGRQLVGGALHSLLCSANSGDRVAAVNTLSWPRKEVVDVNGSLGKEG